MNIEQFISQSEGQWISMRSGHSLAFKQFEQITSKITIKVLGHDDTKVLNLISSRAEQIQRYISPFYIKWEADSDWEEESSNELSSGSSILIPIPKTKQNGFILRSIGYAEQIPSLSSYSFLNDGTFIIKTKYEQTIVEERIWFLSKHVRCRSSVIYASNTEGIMQTSFTSEVKNPKETKA